MDTRGRALCTDALYVPGALHTRLDRLGTLSCGMFWRRSLLGQGLHFPTQYRAIGDAVFVWSLLNAGHRIGTLGEPLAAFTLTGANLGQTDASATELSQWQAGAGFLAQMWRPAVKLAYRLRKASVGAYRVRTIDYAIYTLESPGMRVTFHRERLGWHWPKAGIAS